MPSDSTTSAAAAHNTFDQSHASQINIGPTWAGLPTLSVPAGFNEQGLPLGLQVIGKPNADFEVLQLGYAWEEVVPFLGVEPSLLRAPP